MNPSRFILDKLFIFRQMQNSVLKIRRWLVKEGDAINEHQTILEVETDKAVVEVPSPKKGFVQKIRKLEGEIAKVGDILLTITEKLEEKKEEKKSFGVVGR